MSQRVLVLPDDNKMMSLIANSVVLLLFSFKLHIAHTFSLSTLFKRKQVLLGPTTSGGKSYEYKYLAIGSNLWPPVMKQLRGIDVESSSQYQRKHVIQYRDQRPRPIRVKVPGYRLGFTVGPPGTSSAAVAAVPSSSNHPCTLQGVVYHLTAEEFARVGVTEGVPWVYQWTSVEAQTYPSAHGAIATVSETYVLTSLWNQVDRPTSDSYLNYLRDGAEYWNLDNEYQEFLRAIPTSNNAGSVKLPFRKEKSWYRPFSLPPTRTSEGSGVSVRRKPRRYCLPPNILHPSW